VRGCAPRATPSPCARIRSTCAPRTIDDRAPPSCAEHSLDDELEHEVDGAEIDRHHRDADQHGDRGGARLVACRPVHLSQLGPTLLEKLSGTLNWSLQGFACGHGMLGTGQAGLEPATPGFGVRCSTN